MKFELQIAGVLLILYGLLLVARAPGRADENARQFSAGMGCGVVLAIFWLFSISAVGWVLERA